MPDLKRRVASLENQSNGGGTIVLFGGNHSNAQVDAFLSKHGVDRRHDDANIVVFKTIYLDRAGNAVADDRPLTFAPIASRA